MSRDCDRAGDLSEELIAKEISRARDWAPFEWFRFENTNLEELFSDA